MDKKKADFILKGDEAIYPEVVKNGLEIYYSTRAKKNDDTLRNTIIDMSGNKRHATLTGFDFKGVTGFHDGLVFDGRDDTLTRPGVAGLSPDDLTFQMNGNILRFNPDGTSQRVEDRTMVDVGRNLLFGLKSMEGTKNGVTLTYNNGKIILNGTCTASANFAKTFSIDGGIYTLSANNPEVSPNAGTKINVYSTTVGSITNSMSKVNASTTSSLNSGTGAFRLRIEVGTTYTNFELTPKLELGSFATPWTPAPEDLISNLSYKGNILGDLESTIDDVDVDRVTNTQVMIKGNKKNPIDVTVEGNTVQKSDWYAKEGLSTQYQDTKVMGKNICPTDIYDWENGQYGMNGVKENYPGRIRVKNLVKVSPSTSYYVSTHNKVPGVPIQFVIRSYDANGSFISSIGGLADASVKSMPAGTEYIGIALFDYTGDFYSAILSGQIKPFICLASEPSKAYEPYKDTVKQGLVVDLSGRNFFNYPKTTTLKDRSGNGNHGVASGFSYTSASGSDGNGGIAFNGSDTDDLISIPHLPSVISNNQITVEAVASCDLQTTAHNMIISFYSSTYFSFFGNNPFFSLNIDGAQRLLNSNFTPKKNTPYHLVATYDGHYMKFYVNGELVNTSAEYVGNINIGGVNSKALGQHITGGFPLYGTIYSARIYDRALSAAEVYQNYMAGANLSMPSPEDPSPVVSNLPAGTYKYTSTDGIYEFTIDEDLRGIGASVDRIVFDRASKIGKLERKLGREIINGSEYFGNYGSGMNADISTFNVNIKLSALGYATSWSSHFKNVNGGWDNPISEHYSDHPSNTLKYISVFNRVIGALSSDTHAVRNNKFKSWLSTNNVTFIYRLAKPTTHLLTFTKVPSSTKTEVPMTFFTATPSLEYPAQVWDVEGKIIGRGKNLVDPSGLVANHGNYGGGGYNSAASLTGDLATRNTFKIKVDGGKTYSWKIHGNGFHHRTAEVRGVSGNVATTTQSYITYNSRTIKDRVFTTHVETDEVWISIHYNDTPDKMSFEDTKLMFEEGPIATSYEPYQPIAETTLPTLRKIGTVADTYNPTTGEYVKRIEKKVFDGTESIDTPAGTPPAGYNAYRFLGLSTDARAPFICNLYPFNPELGYTSPIDGECIKTYANTSGQMFFLTKIDRLPTAGDFKAWVASQYAIGEPLTVHYQLKTPVVTYLDPVVPPIYYPTTVIETDSPDYCKPMLNTVVKAVDYLKENRTINNVLLWSRALTDSEMKRQYRLSHERFAMKSTSLKRDPIEMYVNLTSGASTGTTLSTDITLTI